MNFSDILNDYAPYKGIVENLNNTPVSVAGIVESAQGQLIYSLKNENKSSALVVCYSDMEARKLYSDMELYSDNVLYFPTKEYIFYNIETSGHQNEHARISVIQKLVSGGDYIVVTSLDAILQYTCDKEEFESLCIDFELGKTFNLEKADGGPCCNGLLKRTALRVRDSSQSAAEYLIYFLSATKIRTELNF